MIKRGRWLMWVLFFAVITAVGQAASVVRLDRSDKEKSDSGRAVVVAKVKGRDIKLSELNKATAPYRYQYEKQGYDFTSSQGKVTLQRLQLQVLQDMVARELLQKAAREKRVSVSKAEVEKKLQSLYSKRKGGEKELLKEVEGYGWTKQDFADDVKAQLLEEKFIMDHLMKGKDTDSVNDVVNDWLQDNARDGVDILFKVNAPSQGDALKAAEKAGLEYYRKKFGEDAAKGAEAKAANLGCHTQVDIMKGGKIVKSLGYGGGDVYEID